MSVTNNTFNEKKRTITITFGDRAENHKGMQMIGNAATKGFTHTDLLNAKKHFESLGATCEIIHLNKYLPENVSCDEDAYILIAKNGVSAILKSENKNANDLFDEQVALDFDKKAFMYGRVVNKHARWNLCYGDFDQTPDYETGKGRIINFKHIPITNSIRNSLKDLIPSAEELQGEANYYYDIHKCGIGAHGDSERLKVIGVRIGASLPLYYHWYQNSKKIGSKVEVKLDHGDIYIMSEKTTGNDWKQKKKPTLRHCTGATKYIQFD